MKLIRPARSPVHVLLTMNPLQFLDYKHAEMGRTRFYFTLLSLLLLLGMAPVLLIPGLCQGDDIFFHLYRLEAQAEALRNTCLFPPVDWRGFNGYGYGLGLFYCDALLLPVSLLRVIGLPLVPCLKLYLVFWLWLTGASAFYCALRISKSPFGGFAAGLLYAWNTYLATDLFNRFAFGEFLAFAFVPLAILGYYEILCGTPTNYPLLGIAFTGLLLANNLAFLQAAVLFAVLALCHFRRWRQSPARFIALLKAAALCLVLTAFFLLPLLEQLASQRFTVMDKVYEFIHLRTMPFLRLFSSAPDLSRSGNGHWWTPPGLAPSLLLAILARCCCGRPQDDTARFRDILLIVGGIALLMTTAFFPWQILGRRSFLNTFQFPWRFLLGANAFLALGGALTLAFGSHRDWPREKRLLLPLILLSAFAWSHNVYAEYHQNISHGSLVHQAARLDVLEVGVMNYFPAGLTEQYVCERGCRADSSGQVAAISCTRSHFGLTECAFSGENGIIELPLVYYKGYVAKLSNQERLPVSASPNHLVQVTIPAAPGSHVFTVYYAGTWIQPLARAGSLLAAAFLLWHFGRQYIRR